MKVHVKTPARLHLGIIDMNGNLGRMYGSLGLAIQQPNVIIEVSESENLLIEGEEQKRVKETSETFLGHFGINKPYRIKVEKSIPQHVGLGSGTQLELAVARGLVDLFSLDVSTREIAQIIGRGKISGIGTAVFETGGFVVDGGKSSDKSRKNLPPPIISRHAFPDDWLMVIALPGVKKGLSGEVERQTFTKISSEPAELVERKCRLLVMKMIPALLEHNIVEFGAALTDIQVMTGESFSSAQDGKFAGEDVSETVNFLWDKGAYGAGQSSWGPTVYGLVEGISEAESLLEKVQRFLDEKAAGGYAFYTQANNRGAEIEVEEH